MDVAKFVKEYIRMCNSFEITNCKGCAALDELKCCDLNTENPEKLVKIVEQWSQEHPQKTMMQDFFEKFPNAPKGKFGQPQLCPGNCGYNNEIASYEVCKKFCSDCLKCWNRPVED